MASTAWGSQLYYKRRRVFRTRRTMCASASFANTVIESRRGCGVGGLVSGKGKCPARSRRRARYTTQRRDQRPATTMNSFHPGESSSHPFVEPTPLPASIPKVNELGATSAPLKSAAFFIGAYCKEFNGGSYVSVGRQPPMYGCRTEDFMLCKAENRDPAHCLKEGRRVTRCATDLCALSHISLHPTLTILCFNFLAALPRCVKTVYSNLKPIGTVWK